MILVVVNTSAINDGMDVVITVTLKVLSVLDSQKSLGRNISCNYYNLFVHENSANRPLCLQDSVIHEFGALASNSQVLSIITLDLACS